MIDCGTPTESQEFIMFKEPFSDVVLTKFREVRHVATFRRCATGTEDHHSMETLKFSVNGAIGYPLTLPSSNIVLNTITGDRLHTHPAKRFS